METTVLCLHNRVKNDAVERVGGTITEARIENHK